MFTTLFSLSLLLLLVRSVLAQSNTIAISTPVLVQCQQAQINWTDSCSGPYDLLVASASDPCGDAIEDLGYQNETSVSWTVNVAAGTQVMLYIEDSQGNDGWSATITVGTSNDTSCLTNTTSPMSTPPSGSSPTASPSAGTPSSPQGSSVPTAVGAANAGLSSNSGMLSTRPVNAIALFGTTVLAVVAFAL